MRKETKQILTAAAAGTICGAISYAVCRLTGGTPARPDSVWKTLWILLAGPVLEETVFRGIAFAPAQRYLKNTGAVLLCAALFGAAHWGIPNSFIAFGAGVVFGALRVKDNTLLSPILAHMAANAVLLVLQL